MSKNKKKHLSKPLDTSELPDDKNLEEKIEDKTTKDIKKEKKDDNKKAKKDKKGKILKSAKESWGELKKVTWPTFVEVCKKTGAVIVIALIFTVVLFAFDFLLGKLYSLFMG